MTAPLHSSTTHVEAAEWAVVMALKPLAAAKTRIDLGPVLRRQLVLAMLNDTLDAVSRSRRVARLLLVCADPAVPGHLDVNGVKVVGGEPPGDLNSAFEHGAAHARATDPGTPVALMPADLPAMTPGELDLSLRRAGTQREAVLADLDGVGTTLLTQPNPAHQPPRFEKHSHAAHVLGGASPIGHTGLLGIRRDIDTVADLRVAQSIGLGPRTQPLADLILHPVQVAE